MSRRTLGGRNQRSCPMPLGGNTSKSIRQIAPFLNASGVARADQARGQLADVRLVPDQRDAPLAHVLAELLDDGRGRAGRRERVARRDRRLRLQRFREDVGGLSGPDQRAGDDLIEADVERVERRAPLSAAARSPGWSAAASNRPGSPRRAPRRRRGESGTARASPSISLAVSGSRGESRMALAPLRRQAHLQGPRPMPGDLRHDRPFAIVATVVQRRERSTTYRPCR